MSAASKDVEEIPLPSEPPKEKSVPTPPPKAPEEKRPPPPPAAPVFNEAQAYKNTDEDEKDAVVVPPKLASTGGEDGLRKPSPTVAEPSFDPAKEFMNVLLSPSTPFLKRKQLMMEYPNEKRYV